MCAPPFETYFFQFHALFTWKQDVRPPICDKTAPPHLENPGSATGNLLFLIFYTDPVASQSSNYWIQHRK